MKRAGENWYPIEGMENCFSTEPGQKAIAYAPWYEIWWESFTIWMKKIRGIPEA